MVGLSMGGAVVAVVEKRPNIDVRPTVVGLDAQKLISRPLTGRFYRDLHPPAADGRAEEGDVRWLVYQWGGCRRYNR